jgi:hypothetical protein
MASEKTDFNNWTGGDQSNTVNIRKPDDPVFKWPFSETI